MLDVTPPNSQEIGAMAAASSRLANIERRLRRTEWMSRATGALSFALVVGMSVSFVKGDTFAETPKPEATSNSTDDLHKQVDSLLERAASDLDSRIEQQTDEMMRKIAEEQMAALERSDRALAMSQEISGRVETKLAALTAELRGQALAMAQDLEKRSVATRDELRADIDDRIADQSVRIESGSLELKQQTLREGRNERVERGRHRFDHPFPAKPRVALGMRVLDLPRSDRPRVALRVVRVDRKGFDYEIRTWGNSSIAELSADWVAYANGLGAAGPASPR